MACNAFLFQGAAGEGTGPLYTADGTLSVSSGCQANVGTGEMPTQEAKGEITEILVRWSDGDASALEELMEVVYHELHQLASSYLRRERRDHTLQTSALVHEAYLRLIDQRRVRWQNRAHFFGIAARMMRRILVDHARQYLYEKRGSGSQKLQLDEALTLSPDRAPEFLALDEALDDLALSHPQEARIVELRFFVGLSGEEIGHLLGISVRTVSRGWRLARVWLYRWMTESIGHEA